MYAISFESHKDITWRYKNKIKRHKRLLIETEKKIYLFQNFDPFNFSYGELLRIPVWMKEFYKQYSLFGWSLVIGVK